MIAAATRPYHVRHGKKRMNTERKIRCPHCGALNSLGSNICGRCFHDIRDLANPQRADFEQTIRTGKPRRRTLLKRLRRWLARHLGRSR